MVANADRSLKSEVALSLPGFDGSDADPSWEFEISETELLLTGTELRSSEWCARMMSLCGRKIVN